MSAWSANRRGIIAMSGAMGLFTLNDACAKLVLQDYPFTQVCFIRGAFLWAGTGILLMIWRQPGLLKMMSRPPLLGRSVVDGLTLLAGFLALKHMGLGNFAAVNLISPLLLVLLAIMFLKEDVSWQLGLAIAVGLLGAIIVVKPNPATFNPWVAFAFLGTFLSAARDFMTRLVHVGASTLTIVFASTTALSLMSIAAGVAEDWKPLTGQALVLGAGAALFLGLGNCLTIFAIRTARITLVAPFRYTLIVWAPIVGYLVFGDIPDRWLFGGAALIVGAGLYTLHREAALHGHLPVKPPEAI